MKTEQCILPLQYSVQVFPHHVYPAVPGTHTNNNMFCSVDCDKGKHYTISDLSFISKEEYDITYMKNKEKLNSIWT